MLLTDKIQNIIKIIEYIIQYHSTCISHTGLLIRIMEFPFGGNILLYWSPKLVFLNIKSIANIICKNHT